MVANVWLVECLAEIFVWTAETTTKDAGEGGFGPTTVGTGMTWTVFHNELDEARAIGGY